MPNGSKGELVLLVWAIRMRLQRRGVARSYAEDGFLRGKASRMRWVTGSGERWERDSCSVEEEPMSSVDAMLDGNIQLMTASKRQRARGMAKRKDRDEVGQSSETRQIDSAAGAGAR